MHCVTADAADQELDDVTVLKLHKLATAATSFMQNSAMKLRCSDHTEYIDQRYEVYYTCIHSSTR